MKAIVYHHYGSADVLQLEGIEKPVPKDEEVLIKVRAAALNPLDWRMMKGMPSIFRKMMKVCKRPVEAREPSRHREFIGRHQLAGLLLVFHCYVRILSP